MRRKEVGDQRRTGRGEETERNKSHGTSDVEFVENRCADGRRACVEDWQGELRGADVDAGEEDGRG